MGNRDPCLGSGEHFFWAIPPIRRKGKGKPREATAVAAQRGGSCLRGGLRGELKNAFWKSVLSETEGAPAAALVFLSFLQVHQLVAHSPDRRLSPALCIGEDEKWGPPTGMVVDHFWVVEAKENSLFRGLLF